MDLTFQAKLLHERQKLEWLWLFYLKIHILRRNAKPGEHCVGFTGLNAPYHLDTCHYLSIGFLGLYFGDQLFTKWFCGKRNGLYNIRSKSKCCGGGTEWEAAKGSGAVPKGRGASAVAAAKACGGKGGIP